MPRRTDIQSILVIGSGPIVIGQACEFDYSGTQAVRALKREGYRVVLVNSNPATIMTDPELADATYVEPLTPEFLERIVERERPDAILPTVGGQTALNLALALADRGVLDKWSVKLIGANERAVRLAEDRELFKQAMLEIGAEVPRSGTARSMAEAEAVRREIGLPVVVRPSFTLGGTGGGSARTPEEFRRAVAHGLAESPVARGPDRGVGRRLEGVRARGDARPRRQRHHRLLDRELRRDGGPHRRLDHRGARR